jgi:hypothetical protein
MTTSSPHTICWTGSSDTSADCSITLTGTDGSACHTFSYGNTCYPVGYQSTAGTISSLTTSQISTLSSNTISIGNGGTCYTIGNGFGSGIRFTYPEEWTDSFPDFARVQEMCKEYPGLKIAFEKFKTVYKLVKDHYDTPEDQRPRP